MEKQATKGAGKRIYIVLSSDFLSKYGVIIVLVLMVVLFSALLPGTFLTGYNFRLMLDQQVTALILALAILIPLIAGEFDFSAGALLGAAPVFMVKLSETYSFPWWTAVLIVLALAALVGVINGVFISYFGFHSFVATLATSGVVGGGALLVSNGETLFEGIDEAFVGLIRSNVFGVPVAILLGLVVFIFVAWLLRQTAWGRSHEAIGLGRHAATLAGIPIRSHILTSFILSAVLAAFAGLILLGKLGAAPVNLGSSYILGAFSAVFLGAAILRPGFFNATGTFVAVVLLAVGINGLSLAGISSFIEQVFTGLVLILAVGLSRIGGLIRS